MIRPGPRILPRRLNGFFSACSSTALGSTGRPGSTCGSRAWVDAFRWGKTSAPTFGLQLRPLSHQLAI